MKQLKSIKLGKLSERQLQEKEMKVVKGGYKCGCGCASFGGQENTSGQTQSNYDSN